MKLPLLISHLSAVLTLAGPTKRSCGPQCFNSTNACGVEFSGCWDECSIAPTFYPTFLAPPCSATALPLNTTTSTPTTPSPLITPAPNATAPLATPACWTGRTICIDYIQFCGNNTHKYGGCDDVCERKVYSPPECTVSEGGQGRGRGWGGTSTRTRSKKPGATRGACDKEKGFMCAPVGWRE